MEKNMEINKKNLKFKEKWEYFDPSCITSFLALGEGENLKNLFVILEEKSIRSKMKKS